MAFRRKNVSELAMDDLLRSINRRASDIATKFGKESTEYMRQKSLISAILPETLVKRTKDGVVRVTRSKAYQPALDHYRKALEDIYELQLREGTASEQAQKYYKRGVKATPSNLKKAAEENFVYNRDRDEYIYTLAKELGIEYLFKSRKGKTGEDARNEWRKIMNAILREYEKQIDEKLAGKRTPFFTNREELKKRMERRNI